MPQPSPAITKKIHTLAQIAVELRAKKHFNITRLTLLKSLCADEKAAAKFGVHIATLTQERMEARRRPGHVKPKSWARYKRLARDAVAVMKRHVRRRSDKSESDLHGLLTEIRGEQDKYERQRWGLVRIVESMELLVVETALECILHPCASSDLGYRLARQYAERYNSRYGTGLIPESAPMMEEIAEFWGRHYFGRAWREPHVRSPNEHD